MGRRTLIVEPQLLVELCKQHSGFDRMLTVDKNALPDDARVEAVMHLSDSEVHLLLMSDQWEVLPIENDGILEPPVLIIHYPDEVKRGN